MHMLICPSLKEPTPCRAGFAAVRGRPCHPESHPSCSHVVRLRPTVRAGLIALLGTLTEDTLHLALETLAAVVRADAGAGAAFVVPASSAVLKAWAVRFCLPPTQVLLKWCRNGTDNPSHSRML